MTNSILQSLYDRKSVRAYANKPIPEDTVQTILEAAVQAPSAGNQQLYTIIRVSDPEKKHLLSISCDNQPFIEQAPLVLVFCADCLKWYEAFSVSDCEPRLPGEGDLMLAVTDAAIAAQNAVVAAESLGIGSCYIGDIMENIEQQREILCLPRYVFPAVMLVMGYPTDQQMARPKPPRPALEHIVHENTYRHMDPSQLRELLAHNAVSRPYEDWIQAFCNRKYNADFAREMTRSVQEYLKDFQH